MITGLIAAALALLYVKMSFVVIKLRRSKRIAYGAGENEEIIGPVSAHSNFASYAPLSLMMLYLLEASGRLHWGIILAIGLVIFTGRVLHFTGLALRQDFKLRVRGMQLTIIPLVMMSVLLIYVFIVATFFSS